jgi:hypothetical protein
MVAGMAAWADDRPSPAPSSAVSEEVTAKEEPAESKRGLDAIGVPLASYNTDLGLGLGAVGGGFYYQPGYVPYRHGVAAQIFLTTQGVQNHWLRYDGPRLIGEARLELRAEYRRELRAPYYGAGNRSSPGLPVEALDDESHTFDHLYPGAWFRLRHKSTAALPLEVYGGYAYHQVRVRVFPDSVLGAERPRGIEGGSHGQLMGGVLWDSRDHEADPTRGGVEELTARIAAAPTGSRYSYLGVTASERRYVSLGTPRLIFAQRVALDALFGDVPFFEWPMMAGTNGIEGVGGMSSVRGVPRNRFVGNVKAVSNSELRYYPFSFRLFGEQTKLGGLLFFDTGRVWHPATDDGDFWDWHSGAGAGLRVSRRAAVVRLDYGVWLAELRQAVYVTFGHMF